MATDAAAAAAAMQRLTATETLARNAERDAALSLQGVSDMRRTLDTLQQTIEALRTQHQAEGTQIESRISTVAAQAARVMASHEELHREILQLAARPSPAPMPTTTGVPTSVQQNSRISRWSPSGRETIVLNGATGPAGLECTYAVFSTIPKLRTS